MAAQPVHQYPMVLPGFYGLVDHQGVTKFYKVDHGKGKWQGFIIVSVQASDDLWPVRNREQRRQILDHIARDPKAAAERYGLAIGKCGVCGRTLTDEESRRIGIGPICRAERGW